MGFAFQDSGRLTEASAGPAATLGPSMTILHLLSAQGQSAVLGDTRAGQSRAIKRALFLPCSLNADTSLDPGIIWAVLAFNPAARLEGRGKVPHLCPSWFLDQQEDSRMLLSQKTVGDPWALQAIIRVSLLFLSNCQAIQVASKPYRVIQRKRTYCPEAGSHHAMPLG